MITARISIAEKHVRIAGRIHPYVRFDLRAVCEVIWFGLFVFGLVLAFNKRRKNDLRAPHLLHSPLLFNPIKFNAQVIRSGSSCGGSSSSSSVDSRVVGLKAAAYRVTLYREK